MKIKEWWGLKSYWFKGGALGVIFILLYCCLFYVVRSFYLDYPVVLSTPLLPLASSLTFLSTVLNIPFAIVGERRIDAPFVLAIIAPFIALIVSYFIFGALIGWIVGKIKNI